MVVRHPSSRYRKFFGISYNVKKTCKGLQKHDIIIEMYSENTFRSKNCYAILMDDVRLKWA